MVGTWLPMELCFQIIENVWDPSALFSFRLVNRAWNVAASKQLECIAYLSLDPQSQERLRSRLWDESAKDSTKGIVICVPENDYFMTRDSSGNILSTHETIENRWVLKHFFAERTREFQHLVHMAVHFRPPPKRLGPEENSSYFKGMMIYHMMVDLFQAFCMHPGELEELSLHCLPAQALLPEVNKDWEPEPYERTRQVLQRLNLKSLKLGYVGHGVWLPTDVWRWKSFSPPNWWVEPVQATLRHLSITCWGFYIVEWTRFGYNRADWIPNLESLELRGCTFTSDLELKWILNHRDSLRSLKFDDCAILYCLQMDLDNIFDSHSRSRAQKVEKKDGLKMQLCQIRWQEWFHKLRAGLPYLNDFQFGSSRIRAPGEEGPVFESERVKGPRFEQKPKFLFGLFPDRYLEMKLSLRQAPWILDPPEKKYKKKPRCDKSDVVALRLLVKHTKQHVDENDTSDHAGYVKDLIGQVEPREDV